MKIAIGTLVQWYESDIFPFYIKSLIEAAKYTGDDLPNFRTVDFAIYTGNALEKPIDESIKQHQIQSILKEISSLTPHYNVVYREVGDSYGIPYTIADYRRDFNDKYCELADVLFWGETDMLFPKQGLDLIKSLHETVHDDTPKYIGTFSICKMWDNTWKPLEHPEFTDKPFIDGDTENWWSLRYNMKQDEMDRFNDSIDEPTLTTIKPHKFNGCGLIISSDVIKSGVNIPKGAFFVHEDTAFMHMIHKVLPDIPQYHFSNILIVHNRKHPKKRVNIAGEEDLDKTNTGALRKVHPWYDKANKFCEANVYTFSNPNQKLYTWKDVFN